jgi:hypothetical protein
MQMSNQPCVAALCNSALVAEANKHALVFAWVPLSTLPALNFANCQMLILATYRQFWGQKTALLLGRLLPSLNA